MVTMFGWFNAVGARASYTNRLRRPGPATLLAGGAFRCYM